MKAIEIKNLTKKYGNVTAVDNINLIIEEDELFSLLGVNGAGKTTTIKMLTGLIKPSSGDALILNKSIIKELNDIKPLINVSPQETAIAPNLTVEENLLFMANIYKITNSLERVEEIIKDFSLEKNKNKKAKKLSGGWQRRLSLAMAVLTKPKILFLDEPTLGLDVIARKELWKIIMELKKTTTIVLTTHYMEEAEELSDHVGIMKEGKIIEVGTPKEIIKKTKSKNMEDAFVKLVMGE